MRRHQFLTLTIFLASLAVSCPADAQKVYEVNRRIDSTLAERYQRANFDTNYVSRPQTKWTLIGRVNMSGARIRAEGQANGSPFETEMKADYKTTVSVGVSYMGLSLNLSINPAKMFGKYHDYELGFRSYGKRFGFDIAYQDAHNFKGWHEVDGVRQEMTMSEDMFKLRTLNVNAYYVFNYRRFSYPAAFAHSFIQRRSAGSFLLAASGQGQHGKVAGDEEGADGERQPLDFKMTNIAIGAGYGYNYVPGRSWLIHLSALPTYVFYTNSSITVGDTRIPLHHHFPEGIITTRAAIVKQIGRNKFAGISAVYNFTNIGYDKELAIRNQKWNTRLYFGFRL